MLVDPSATFRATLSYHGLASGRYLRGELPSRIRVPKTYGTVHYDYYLLFV